MALRLGEYVVYGELRNAHYGVSGVIVLRGAEQGAETPVHLNLTGDCDPDLKGRHVRFGPGEDDVGEAVFRMQDHSGFQVSQIGPTGTMTAQGWVRTLPCPPEEFMRRSKLGEPPPTPWKRQLYLEWYSQNGRVVVELPGAHVEECTREPRDADDEGDWAPLPNLALPPELDASNRAPGPEFVIVRNEGDTAYIETWTPAAPRDAIDGDDEFEDPDDPDGLRDLDLMDYCLEHAEEQPIASLLDGVDHLPPDGDMDDEEVEVALKGLLAQMAALGIALDVCEHFSPRDCYRLLIDRVLREPSAFSELCGSGWVQHIMTHEHCRGCEAED